MPHDPGPLSHCRPARIAAGAALPWIPSGLPGLSVQPLRFLADGRGFVELLRMPPGSVMPLHRHSGEAHAYQLSGWRQLCGGEIVGPGDYVYEPAGHVDWWKVVGDEILTALVVTMGAIEFLGPGGSLRGRTDADGRREAYRRYCGERGLDTVDLEDA
ncbi:cupin domain-containing protein [Lysobacter antibioticus]|uniref:cupin domain-containing protein n=1 Tax=Lysobacter antibioticus TaxID=84531 RepID=UPI0007E8B891|nr:cupin domain-containing protein [Lysobacter antibioticus]